LPSIRGHFGGGCDRRRRDWIARCDLGPGIWSVRRRWREGTAAIAKLIGRRDPRSAFGASQQKRLAAAATELRSLPVFHSARRTPHTSPRARTERAWWLHEVAAVRSRTHVMRLRDGSNCHNANPPGQRRCSPSLRQPVSGCGALRLCLRVRRLSSEWPALGSCSAPAHSALPDRGHPAPCG
jgi:hypothetical protein